MTHFLTLPPLEQFLTLKQVEELAQLIGPQLQAGDVIYLKGNLGSGKTTFARALIQGLMGPDTIVPSPTFTLVQPYAGHGFDITHYDLYRLKTVDDCLELGFDEALSSGALLIEWPERLGTLRLSPRTAIIHFTLDPRCPDQRQIQIDAV